MRSCLRFNIWSSSGVRATFLQIMPLSYNSDFVLLISNSYPQINNVCPQVAHAYSVQATGLECLYILRGNQPLCFIR